MNFQMETFDDLEKDFVKNFNVTKPESQETIDDKGIKVAGFDQNKEVNIKDIDEDVIMDDDMNEIKSYFAEN